MVKRFNLIAAINRSGVIGVDGKIPWSYPADMKHFKEVTSEMRDKGGAMGFREHRRGPTKAIIMGRKTWISLNGPLPHRQNIIISESMNWEEYNKDSKQKDLVAVSVEAACEFVKDYDEVWVIGGASIYNQFLEKDLIERILITIVPVDFPINGTRFPTWPPYIEENGQYCFHPSHNHGNSEIDCGFSLHNTTIKKGLIVHDFRRVE